MIYVEIPLKIFLLSESFRKDNMQKYYRTTTVTDSLGALRASLHVSSLSARTRCPDFQPEIQPGGFLCPLELH